MYKLIHLNEIDNSLNNYKLCYIDSIQQTDFIYDEFAEFDKKYKEVPHKDYIKGEQELYAFFTPLELDEQWGDDWNDAPYDCNAGYPYDTDDNTKEITIIQVPFVVKSYNYNLPSAYGYNTPFCVLDMNQQACAWIHDSAYDKNTHKYKGVSILAGVSPLEFKAKLEQIHKNNPDWKPLEDE